MPPGCGDRPALNFHLPPHYQPIIAAAVLSVAGTLFYQIANNELLLYVLYDRWSLRYFLLSPFIHAGAAHAMLNIMALHYVGGMMLLPLIGARRLVFLFITAAVVATAANNLLTPAPAIGISAAVMALLSCCLYRYANAPMKFIILHDLLRLPPFRFRHVVAFIVLMDVIGIVFGWHFFAHWAHLTGFAVGLIAGYFIFRYRR